MKQKQSSLLWRCVARSLLVAFALVVIPAGGRAQDATPVSISCASVDVIATVGSSGHDMSGHDAASPIAGMHADADFDQRYIDMMIPHHQAVVALAQVALPTLTEPRLQAIAQAIIDTQTAEIAELTAYRLQFYGDAQPMPINAQQMMLMMAGMPGVESSEAMAMQMDPVAQVAAFCAAANPDLAFIDQTIPHHEMAVAASHMALTAATHPEINAFAQKVIDAQTREITELTTIRQELVDAATPVSAG